MLLANMNYKEVEEYLKKHDTVIIPVGSIENHGLHMPLGTDTMIPTRIGDMIVEKSEWLVAPTIPYGATDDLVGFAGTISIGTTGLTDLVMRIVDELYRYGFRRFLFLNGHGGNTAALQTVCNQLSRREKTIGVIMNWWLMAGQMNPEWKGGHGGGEETAGVMAVDPTLIKQEYIHRGEEIRNDISDELVTAAWTSIEYKGVSVTVPRTIKRITENGWLAHGMGSDEPSRATVEMGVEMLTAVSDYIIDLAGAFERATI